ncbi:MAG: von Willebrand factor type A domain-containing protein, partial [Nonlabens sp.]
MKTILLFTAFLLITTGCFAKTITGKVTGPDSDEVIGVTITIKGSSVFTSTNFDGDYSIEAAPEDILVFSYTGYDSQEILVGNQMVINIQLTSSSLDAVIVTGYRNYNKQNSSKASSTNTTRPNTNAIQRLSGQTAGIRIQNVNGQPGTNSTIQIRGAASINSRKKPLVVINGKTMTEKELKNLNPSDISGITVLKDASATAIYGNRGTNGVILIDTEKDIKLNEAEIVMHQIRDLFENESYKNIEENEFEQVGTSPLSTFSIDVDKASYSNVRRMINNGQTVAPDAVKVEEMINYFNYDYDQPTGDHPFAVHTAVSKTPWNKETQLVKIGLQGKDINKDDLPASHLTFLIDVSGSMSNQNKLPLLKSAFKILVEQLREQDKVSIVVYAGAAGIVLEPTSGA